MPSPLELELQLAEGQRHDPSGTPVGPYLHGQYGLFNQPGGGGTDIAVMSAIMAPLGGLADSLPIVSGEYGTGVDSVGSVDNDASVVITGVTSGDLDTWENQPTGDCADGPTGGLLKAGSFLNPYGRIRGKTREVSIVRAGRIENTCEPLTQRLMNSPSGFGGLGRTTQLPSLQNAINNELASRIFEALYSMQRMFSKRIWTGTPANNSGERKDIWGLESQINTSTHRDKNSGVLLTALDPDVKSFGFNLVGGSGPNIARKLEAIDQFIMFKAEQQGFYDYEYDLVMRYGAFMEITSVWPIAASFQALALIASKTNGTVNFSGDTILQARNDMRKNKYLMLNGRPVRVIIDGSLPEKNVTTASALSAGQYASDIFFVPRRANNMPLTFWKYHNHNNGQENAMARLAGSAATFTSDNGLFRWYIDFKDGCLVLKFEFSPKLVLVAPQLAGRLTNVAYQPEQHEDEVYPDSNYFKNGGGTSSIPQKFYSDWNPTTPA